MAATIQDVAARAGVSGTTVSLAFKPGPTRISEKTRLKILKIAKELNYVPNLAARTLRNGLEPTIGVVLNNITNPFYALMAQVIEKTAQDMGFLSIWADNRWDPKQEVSNIKRMIQTRVQGVITCFSEQTTESIELLKAAGMPHIAIDTYPEEYKGSYVANDLIAAGRLAAEHLANIGTYLPILIVPSGGRRYFSSFARLIEGFAAELHARRVPFDEKQIFHSDLTIAGGMEVFHQIRRKFPAADGVLCGNDLCAIGLIEAMNKVELQEGRNIAVIGIDDLDISALSRVSLTSIKQPHEEIAKTATYALLGSIQEKQPVNIHVSLKPKLIVRNSTRR